MQSRTGLYGTVLFWKNKHILNILDINIFIINIDYLYMYYAYSIRSKHR